MKIMALSRMIGTPVSEPLMAEIIPDSAILKDNKPLFLPQFSSTWSAEIAVAYRICRLGKNIGQKFASRYYDAFTVALRLVPEDLKKVAESSAIATSFDNALIIGEWIPAEDIQQTITITIGNLSIDLDAQSVSIDEAVKNLSRYFTFKIGDMVIPALVGHSFPVSIDSNVCISVCSREIMNFKIK